MAENTQNKTIAQYAEEGGWCDGLVEDVAKYYKKLILSTIPHLEDGLAVMVDYDAPIDRKKIEELKSLIHVLKSETYGTK